MLASLFFTKEMNGWGSHCFTLTHYAFINMISLGFITHGRRHMVILRGFALECVLVVDREHP